MRWFSLKMQAQGKKASQIEKQTANTCPNKKNAILHPFQTLQIFEQLFAVARTLHLLTNASVLDRSRWFSRRPWPKRAAVGGTIWT